MTVTPEVERLRKELRSRDIFVSTLAHDLRNLSSATRLSLELLQDELLIDSQHQLFSIAKRNLSRIESMIQNLLDIKKITSDGFVLPDATYCKLNDILRAALDVLEPQYGKYFKVSEPSEILGFWSPNLMRRLIVNLASNGFRYGTPGGNITIQVTQGLEYTTIKVHNFGEPISAEDLKVLFTPYFRSSKAKKKSKGWGLGLPMVLKIANAHNGKVEVESNTNAGTTFTVTVPNDYRANTH